MGQTDTVEHFWHGTPGIRRCAGPRSGLSLAAWSPGPVSEGFGNPVDRRPDFFDDTGVPSAGTHARLFLQMMISARTPVQALGRGAVSRDRDDIVAMTFEFKQYGAGFFEPTQLKQAGSV